MDNRESWSGKSGFILACIGAAIGLGNIWLFPWRLGAYGGAAFLIPYLIFVFGFVVFGLIAEMAFGRSQGKGAIGAFEGVFPKETGPLGVALGAVPVLAVSGILVFYLIVLGWIIRYLFTSAIGALNVVSPEELFGNMAGHAGSIPWHVLAAALTMLVVSGGIQKGLEKCNRIAMPLFFVLLGVLLIRSVTLPGARDGFVFLLKPQWNMLLHVKTWVMALGQSFFTVSLGGMLIYGSYLQRDVDLPDSCCKTAIANSSSSLLVALIIVPAVFAFNLDMKSGPDLLFITLPHIFKAMPHGNLFGTIFFFSVFLAGISSAINLMEVPVEGVMDRTGWSRRRVTFLVGVTACLIGLPLDVNMAWFVKWADGVTIYFFPLGALLIQVVFFWVYNGETALAEINAGAKRPFGKPMLFFLKYVFPTVCLLVLVLGAFYGGIG